MSTPPRDARSLADTVNLLLTITLTTSVSRVFSSWDLMATLLDNVPDFSTLQALVSVSPIARGVYERFPRTAVATILKRYSPGVRRIATALVARDEVILETWACQKGFESSYLTGSNEELPKTITDPIGTLMKLTAVFRGAKNFARAIHVAQDAEISAGMISAGVISQRPSGIYEQSRLQDIISGTEAVPKGSFCFVPCFNQEYQTSNPKDPTIMEYIDDAQRLYWNYVILQDMRSTRTRRCTSCGKRCVNRMYDTLTTSLLKQHPMLWEYLEHQYPRVWAENNGLGNVHDDDEESTCDCIIHVLERLARDQPRVETQIPLQPAESSRRDPSVAGNNSCKS